MDPNILPIAKIGISTSPFCYHIGTDAAKWFDRGTLPGHILHPRHGLSDALFEQSRPINFEIILLFHTCKMLTRKKGKRMDLSLTSN